MKPSVNPLNDSTTCLAVCRYERLGWTGGGHTMGDPQPSESSIAATEAQIAVHCKEEEYLNPSPEFIAQANLTDQFRLEPEQGDQANRSQACQEAKALLSGPPVRQTIGVDPFDKVIAGGSNENRTRRDP